MDKAMSADLDRHLTTEPENGTLEYNIMDVPAIRALLTMNVPSNGGYFDLEKSEHLDVLNVDEDGLRQRLYDYYEANDMAKSLFGVGWERGVERQELRLIEADEVNEGEDEIEDSGEARFYYLHGYMAGQHATYQDPDGVQWATPWTATHDDEFLEG